MRAPDSFSTASLRTFDLLARYALIGFIAFLAAEARAANGTWTQLNSGLNWSDPTNWSGGTIANGAGFTADFSTLNITATTSVILDSSRTIGQLKFQDATTADNNWTLDNGGVTTNVLTLDNGASQPIISVLNRQTTIVPVLNGTNGVILTGGNAATLALSGANTYTGTTRINSTTGTATQFTLLLQNNSALGTGNVIFDPLAGGTNQAQISLDSGVTISNNITLNTVRSLSGGNGALRTNGDVNATFTGTITINGNDAQGGDFVGAQEAAYTPTGNFLTFTGPINLTLPSTVKSAAGGAGNALVARAGNVRLAGGGSYFRIEDRAGILQVGATNGVATNAYVDLGGNSNGNPQNYSVLDLNGFNQTLVGISNYVGNGNAATVTNSSSTTPVVLTLVPANPTTNPNQANLVYTSGATGTTGNAVISDSGSTAPLSIVVNGDPAGTQYFIVANGSYQGTTTLTSGTLAVSTLSDGGVNSSIGASPSDAGNLVFNGGTLRYVNIAPNQSDAPQALANSTTPSTNRNFTINAGKSGTIDVASIGTTLTMSGGSAATNGQLIKAGIGTLILSGPNLHTGGTSVNAGTLMVNNPGSLAIGAVSVASGATLAGDGTIGGTVSLASGGTLSPGNLGVGTFTVGGLTLNNGGIVNFEFGGTNDLIAVTNAGGLTLNGGNLNLFNAGTTGGFFQQRHLYLIQLQWRAFRSVVEPDGKQSYGR